MAKAKVNIENVEMFCKSIKSQRDSVYDNIETFKKTLYEFKEAIKLEKDKVSLLLEEIRSTLSTLQNKINEQQAKVEELEISLSNLEASEPCPAEELIVEPDEYDEEGNLISAGSSHYEETAAHIAWRGQVEQLRSELQTEEEKLNQMQEIEGQLQSVLSEAEKEQYNLEEADSKLDVIQEELDGQKNRFDGFSEDVVGKLSNIAAILQEYVSMSIASHQGFWSRVIYPNVTISGMSAGKFKVSRVPTMSKTFDDSPNWIRKEVAAYGNNVKIVDKKCRSHYNHNERKIYMASYYDNDEYAEVFKHEFGHFIDHQHGWLSHSKNFVDAYYKDCQNLDISTSEGLTNTNMLLSELMNGESAKYDRCISDILSATYYNASIIRSSYNWEGLPYYQHDNQYWAHDKKRETEVFANLFAIYSNNDNESINFIKNNFPNTDRVFRSFFNN